jgi:response regulator RpfG family c-di-GMP phosphodiesterase
VSDQRMPEMLGIELLAKVRELSPNTMRLLLTGYSDLAAIVGSVNDGEVFRFISKPWDQEEIKKTIADAIEIAVATWQVKPGAAASYTQEIAATSVAKHKAELLIIDDNAMDREWIARLFEADYRTFAASSIADAVKVLEQQNAGVIVSESSVAGEDAGMLLKILKQKYPVITTVMLTGNADADEVIKLINQAQIYRFATKPIRKAALELAVASAAKQHERLVNDPRLRARHKVVETEETEHSARFGFFGKRAT